MIIKLWSTDPVNPLVAYNESRHVSNKSKPIISWPTFTTQGLVPQLENLNGSHVGKRVVEKQLL